MKISAAESEQQETGNILISFSKLNELVFMNESFAMDIVCLAFIVVDTCVVCSLNIYILYIHV